MAGSLTWQAYTDDEDVLYSVKRDESNGRATVGGQRLLLARTAAHDALPSNLTPRYILAYLNSNPSIKRKFIVGNPEAITQIREGGAFLAVAYPTADDTAGTPVAWTITAYRGEKLAIIPALNTTTGDTGLDDGTPAIDG
jgi:hypothetical protein